MCALVAVRASALPANPPTPPPGGQPGWRGRETRRSPCEVRLSDPGLQRPDPVLNTDSSARAAGGAHRATCRDLGAPGTLACERALGHLIGPRFSSHCPCHAAQGLFVHLVTRLPTSCPVPGLAAVMSLDWTLSLETNQAMGTHREALGG